MHFVSVVIADRHPVVLLGLSKLLGPESGFQVVASCNDAASCVEAVRHFRPDIAVVDISILGLTGLGILTTASSESLPTRLVFFAASILERELVMPTAQGVYGVISKDAPPDSLMQSLRQVADGQRLLPLPASDEAEAQHREIISLTENVLTVLTERERQIMRLVSEGLSNKEIGRRLNIADGTIKQHLHHIFRKLEISNRTVLAALAISRQ